MFKQYWVRKDDQAFTDWRRFKIHQLNQLIENINDLDTSVFTSLAPHSLVTTCKEGARKSSWNPRRFIVDMISFLKMNIATEIKLVVSSFMISDIFLSLGRTRVNKNQRMKREKAVPMRVKWTKVTFLNITWDAYFISWKNMIAVKFMSVRKFPFKLSLVISGG